MGHKTSFLFTFEQQTPVFYRQNFEKTVKNITLKVRLSLKKKPPQAEFFLFSPKVGPSNFSRVIICLKKTWI